MADSTTKPIGQDATGYEVLTEAMKALLNDFPGLEDGEKILFENLGDKSGICFTNNSGALIYTEKKDVIGGVHQECKYPFLVIYRTEALREKQKLNIQAYLDTLGKWLCREPAVIDDETIVLARWPTLAQGRKIKRITRENSYAAEPQGNGVQDWVLPLTVQYTNDFEL